MTTQKDTLVDAAAQTAHRSQFIGPALADLVWSTTDDSYRRRWQTIAAAVVPVAEAALLGQLHAVVLAALNGARQAEEKARESGRDGDATLNAARVDAFDWVLQRLDEEQEKAR
jgi:hypothetical protein